MDLPSESTINLKSAEGSPLLASQFSLDESLREIATRAIDSFQAQGCAILLLVEPKQKEPKFQIFTPIDSSIEAVDPVWMSLHHAVAGYVAETGKNLEIPDLLRSQFAPWVNSSVTNPPKSLISSPIYLGTQMIGVISINAGRKHTHFTEKDQETLQVLALAVSKSVHISQLHTILRSRFIEIAVLRDWEEQNKALLKTPTASTMTPLPIASDPNKLAKIVAKSFFKELTQAGFDANQIIAIATEVLSLLQNSLNKHKKRLARDEGEE